jgi:hypothetical protein
MSYTKHTWVDGELVTAAKMNNIENGIEEASSGGGSGGGVLVVHQDTDGKLDKTWQEIHDSDFAVLKRASGTVLVTTGAYEEDGEYGVGFFTYGADPTVYIATSASGYPTIEEDENVS